VANHTRARYGLKREKLDLIGPGRRAEASFESPVGWLRSKHFHEAALNGSPTRFSEYGVLRPIIVRSLRSPAGSGSSPASDARTIAALLEDLIVIATALGKRVGRTAKPTSSTPSAYSTCQTRRSSSSIPAR
jgi:hypothetical protein